MIVKTPTAMCQGIVSLHTYTWCFSLSLSVDIQWGMRIELLTYTLFSKRCASVVFKVNFKVFLITVMKYYMKT